MELRIRELLTPERVLFRAAPAGRLAAIDALLALHAKSGILSDRVRYRADVLLREAEGSTALGRGLAIPHARSAGVLRPALAAMTAPAGVDWAAPDQRPIQLIFLIAAPIEGGDLHLRMLAKLMGLLVHGTVSARLAVADSPDAFWSAIAAEERAIEKENGGPSYGQ